MDDSILGSRSGLVSRHTKVLSNLSRLVVLCHVRSEQLVARNGMAKQHSRTEASEKAPKMHGECFWKEPFIGTSPCFHKQYQRSAKWEP